jgi:phytoene synthase
MYMTHITTEKSDSKISRDHWMENLIGLAVVQDKNINKDIVHPTLLRDVQSCYEYATRITAYHSKSFYLASSLLPKEKRNSVRALYAFCRTTDDIVDMSSGKEDWHLGKWRSDIQADLIRFNDPVAIAWADTQLKFNIPSAYAHQLIDGVEMDLNNSRYANFQQLSRYCYGVASTVGLMSMHIIGFKSPKAIPYAIKLGVALQLTNILRDIEEDWERNRIYLPQDEMDAFGIDESYLTNKTNNGRWKQFMKFQIERTRNLYEEAWPGIKMLNKEGQFAIAAAATFYKKILTKIEANNYDVFSHRASLSKWEKLRQIPDLMMKYKYDNSFNIF